MYNRKAAYRMEATRGSSRHGKLLKLATIIVLYDRFDVCASWLGELSLPELIDGNVKASTECPCNTELSIRVSLKG